MKSKFTFRGACMAALLLTSSLAQATIWRVNNNTTVQADFRQISEANSAARVAPGDTLYVEGSATNYLGFNLTKRMVIIGPGYFLSGANGNPGLQVNPESASATMYIDSLASGSIFKGLELNAYADASADDILIERCKVTLGNWKTSGTMRNWKINKCYLSFRITTYPSEKLEITNSIIDYIMNYTGGSNTLFRNNIVNSVNFTMTNAYISNNIFLGGNTFNATSSTVKYNLSTGNNLPAGNNNQNSVSAAALFVGGDSADGKFMLAAGSPAIAAGEPINGITPDCGPFGTPDPYKLSGIPPIPTIYELIVPETVPSNATSMNITISTRSNN